MSMLSERRRKQKWSLNPQGTNWSRDTTKYGQKMLERMGWSEGKGLGRNEDGIREHVKVSYKNDIKGIGFKNSIEWSLQHDNFNTLLQELNDTKEETPTPKQSKSLELESKKSRVRVHYRKFTRGKDLSRYSEKDLANILGKKSLKCDVIDATIDDNLDCNTINKGCMTDYFKSKLPKCSMSISNNFNANSSKRNSASEGECPTFGFGFNNINNTTSKVNEIKSTKNRKQKNLFVSYLSVEDTSNLKSKKRKTSQESKDTDLGLNNPAFEPLGKPIVIKKHILDTITENEEEQEATVVDIKQNSSGIEEILSISINKENNELVDSPLNEITKTNKKKRNFLNENNKIKKKKLKHVHEGIENPNFNVESVQEIQKSEQTIEENPYEEKPKKKKKKKRENKIEGIDNFGLKDDSIEDEFSSCDIMLNVVEKPVSTILNNKSKRVHRDQIISDHVASKNDIAKRNELFDINTKVFQDSLRNFNNDASPELTNHSFEFKYLDNKLTKQQGLDNYGFDAKRQKLEEDIDSFSKQIEGYQAEVENNINESKIKNVVNEEIMIGEINNFDGENERHEEGVLLRYKYALFNKKTPSWAKNKDEAVSWPKKSYKHLIRGDIILGFKDSNLHNVNGYGKIG